MITIYHNPHCSKSREALALAEAIAAQRGTSLSVVEYLSTPPGLEELKRLRDRLGGDTRQLVRSNEEEYTSLQLDQADDDALLAAVAAHPKLLQRPIVVEGSRAIIARPPELVREFLETP